MSDYEKTTWVDDETPVDAEHLNHMEGGIEDAQSTANSVKDSIPTKTSELTNDSGFITDSALEDYAKESDVEAVKETADSALETATEAKEAIPTKVSELDNDVPYATQSALSDVKVTVDQVDATATAAQRVADDAYAKATEVADSAITGINVNGTAQPVENNIAELTIEEGGGAIEHIQVNGTEQPIEDKTVNLDIDRSSVEDETLIIGDTEGYSPIECIEVNGDAQPIKNNTVNIEVPTKVSELDNDVPYASQEAVDKNAEDISALNNDLANNQRMNTYRALGDIGLSTPTTTLDILNQMRNNGYLNSEIYFFGGVASITDLPRGDGVLHVVMGNSTSSRFYIAEYSCNNASGVTYYRGFVASGWSSLTWYLMTATEVNTTSLQNAELEPI